MSTEPKRAALADLAALEQLNADALRQAWRDLLGVEPPPLRAPELLRRELAARLQARCFGGLNAKLKQRLDRLAQQSRRATK